MTNEKAREVLQEQIDRYGEEYDAEGIEALEVAIKALKIMQGIEDAYMRELLKTPLEIGEKLYDE